MQSLLSGGPNTPKPVVRRAVPPAQLVCNTHVHHPDLHVDGVPHGQLFAGSSTSSSVL